MSTAKKTLYATIGAGDKAFERVSTRLSQLPGQFGRAGSIRDLPKTAASIRSKSAERAAGILRTGSEKTQEILQTGVGRTSELVSEARKQATREYAALAKRGEKVVGNLRPAKPAPKKASKPRAKTNGAKAAVGTLDTSIVEPAEQTLNVEANEIV